MDAISESEFQKNIAGIYRAVFANDDPFDARFQSQIVHRLLLYPFTYGLWSDDPEPWLIPVKKAIETMDENGFYLSLLDRPSSEPWHWYVPLEEAHLYVEKIYPRDNVIYSINGRWGVICSDDDFAVLGGPEIMVNIIKASVRDLDDRLEWFLEAWKEYHEQNARVDISWLPTLISHVYGSNLPDFITRKPDLKSLLKF